MRTTSYTAITAVVLGVIAIVISFGAGLALMDIASGDEPGLMLEWIAVWAALVVVVVAQTTSIVVILRLQQRSVSKGDAASQH